MSMMTREEAIEALVDACKTAVSEIENASDINTERAITNYIESLEALGVTKEEIERIWTPK